MKQYKITQQQVNQRLDKILSQLDETLSRTRVQKLLEEEKIWVNGKLEKASFKVKKEDIIEIEEEKVKQVGLKAEDIPLNVLYEDQDVIVINKAKGMVVHPANGHEEGTLVNALMNHCKGSLSGIGGEIRPGIVHRLDKDTSGVLIVAKKDKAHQGLAQQIKNRQMKKTYLALVRGVIQEQQATIQMPIARSKVDRKKMAVDKEGKEAITHFEVLQRYDNYTLLQVVIETGRTHQIRVHLSSIGYPIIGDTVYSNGKNEFQIEGQMLHACTLEWTHPIMQKRMKTEAPLPEYFETILKKLEPRKL